MSETIKQRLQSDMKDAMRAQDKARLGVIRLINAEIKRKEVDERISVDDAQTLAILDKMLKQRRDSISQFETAGRNDLVEKESFEVSVIQGYMPKAMSEAEIDTAIAKAITESGATSAKDMGKVMAVLKPAVQGRCDMTVVSQRVKAKLGA